MSFSFFFFFVIFILSFTWFDSGWFFDHPIATTNVDIYRYIIIASYMEHSTARVLYSNYAIKFSRHIATTKTTATTTTPETATTIQWNRAANNITLLFDQWITLKWILQRIPQCIHTVSFVVAKVFEKSLYTKLKWENLYTIFIKDRIVPNRPNYNTKNKNKNRKNSKIVRRSVYKWLIADFVRAREVSFLVD